MTRQVTLDIPTPHDIAKAEVVEVTFNQFTGRLWINVDGQCVLRVKFTETVKFDDGEQEIVI